MKLHFTSGYHPEADRQTEQVNQTLEQYIWIYCMYQQDDWSNLLPMAKFAYNNALNASTGISPFFTNKGYNLNISICPKINIQLDHAQDFVTNLDKNHSFLWEEITLAQNWYKEQANQKHIPAPDFPIGPKVFVYAKHIKSNWPTKKFSEKYLGPFQAIAWPSTLSYKLQFPKYLSQIHPVFHVSQLEPVFSVYWWTIANARIYSAQFIFMQGLYWVVKDASFELLYQAS